MQLHWEVRTSCYLGLPHCISCPDWLTCTLTEFGPRGCAANDDNLCSIPAGLSTLYGEAVKTTIDSTVSCYATYPVGYTEAYRYSCLGWNTSTYTSYYDVNLYEVECCLMQTPGRRSPQYTTVRHTPSLSILSPDAQKHLLRS
ncbi:hypothetical protein F5Y16DRAFT_64537 [Xylariaceae sp. FL0255]|nr:hypothetical protein F5Y16DRAFT_64537 [Xylariaceae sp. FL0255]